MDSFKEFKKGVRQWQTPRT